MDLRPGWDSPHALVLSLGTSRFTCALELDHPDYAINGGDLGPEHTLDGWLTDLDRLAAGGGPVVLLPFHFADQCTGWLRVSRVDDQLVEVQSGWSGVTQYDLAPADLTEAHHRIFDFEPVPDARIVRPLADIIAAVAAARGRGL